MHSRQIVIGSSLGLCLAAIGWALATSAQPTNPALPPPSVLAKVAKQDTFSYGGSVSAAQLLRVPVTGIIPGGVKSVVPNIKNPLANDSDAATRGMRDLDTFNCSGCHAANGAGGMGPALSNNRWIYRSSPANIYLDIVQGRAHGMPAWGVMLPDRTVWELVAYIQSISKDPDTHFGTTTSAVPQSPAMEQVPAEKIYMPDPWRYTEPFSKGQRPS